MRGFGCWLRAQPRRFATLFVASTALVVVATGLFLLTVASYTRNGSS